MLLELKTRQARRVYPSDVIELSAQRLAVMAQTGRPVVGYAYVLISLQNGGGMVWRGVQLMNSKAVTALALRRDALLAGEAVARCARSSRMCRACSFRWECQSS